MGTIIHLGVSVKYKKCRMLLILLYFRLSPGFRLMMLRLFIAVKKLYPLYLDQPIIDTPLAVFSSTTFKVEKSLMVSLNPIMLQFFSISRIVAASCSL